MALFAPDGNLRWKVMPMPPLNETPRFLAMMIKLQMEWDKLAKERGIKHDASKIIIDDVLLYGRKSKQLIKYSKTALDVL